MSELLNMNQDETLHCHAVPVISLSGLRKGPVQRSAVVNRIGEACRRVGFFKISDHGICESILEGAISAGNEFMGLPREEKMKLEGKGMGRDVYSPVRYGTSLEDGGNKIQREFLKHYAHPLEDYVHLWPTQPSQYREKMGRYCKELRALSMELIGAISESLGLSTKTCSTISNKMEQGIHMSVVNGYPPNPTPKASSLGLSSHTDYCFITILLQNLPGLEIMTLEDPKWTLVPLLKGTLEVHVGDQLEILSNGLYKSVVHRAVLNAEEFRISIASIHHYAMNMKMETAEELIDDENPRGYQGSSFSDFLKFLSINGRKSFVETLKINN